MKQLTKAALRTQETAVIEAIRQLPDVTTYPDEFIVITVPKDPAARPTYPGAYQVRFRKVYAPELRWEKVLVA